MAVRGRRVPFALLVRRRRSTLAAKCGDSAAPYKAALFCGGVALNAAPMCVARGWGWGLARGVFASAVGATSP
ncbi:hypothetical protein DFH09DRAFT_1179929 [Mycena vulgaris]|nr:hypothetical protein DFH09DRAFT_1179929 [Mycena vulgaris]